MEVLDREGSERRELVRLMETLTDAINAGRFDDLPRHLARDFALTLLNGERLTDRRSLDAFLDRWFTGPDRLVRSVWAKADLAAPATFLGPDHALAHGSLLETFDLGYVTHTYDMLWTAVLAREDGAWRLMSFQTTVDVLDNPVVRDAKRLMALGTAGGVLAGVLGSMLARRFGGGSPRGR